MGNNNTVNSWIYRCANKNETYLFSATENPHESLPGALRQVVGPLEFVMKLELHENRTLARADVVKVMQALEEQGYYLQLPPRDFPLDGPSQTRH
ncbi:MAG: hypothetical protein GKR94_19640 [Gammaproteobacteria bacterium]|nr:hypothetical protein [Gammaproteobacteria bacterium]